MTSKGTLVAAPANNAVVMLRLRQIRPRVVRNLLELVVPVRIPQVFEEKPFHRQMSLEVSASVPATTTETAVEQRQPHRTAHINERLCVLWICPADRGQMVVAEKGRDTATALPACHGTQTRAIDFNEKDQKLRRCRDLCQEVSV